MLLGARRARGLIWYSVQHCNCTPPCAMLFSVGHCHFLSSYLSLMWHYYAVLVKPADSHPPQSFEVGLKPSHLNSKASFHIGFLHWFLFKQYTFFCFFFFPQLKFRIFKSTFELNLFTEPPPGKRSHDMVRTKDTTGAASLWSRYELAGSSLNVIVWPGMKKEKLIWTGTLTELAFYYPMQPTKTQQAETSPSIWTAWVKLFFGRICLHRLLEHALGKVEACRIIY